MKTIALKKEISLLVFTKLLLVAFIVPIIFNQQVIVGPIVNAVLFVATMTLGLRYGALIAVFPSAIATLTGLMPVSFLVPFIVLANIVLVSSFHYLRKTDYWIAVVFASFLKFSFLYTVAYLLFYNTPVAIMMGWPQLFTALLGGVIAFLYIKITS